MSLRLGVRSRPAACSLPPPSSTSPPAVQSFLLQRLSCCWGRRSSLTMSSCIGCSLGRGSSSFRFSSVTPPSLFIWQGAGAGLMSLFGFFVRTPPASPCYYCRLRTSGGRAAATSIFDFIRYFGLTFLILNRLIFFDLTLLSMIFSEIIC